MGHCSNRSETRGEKLSRWTKEISQNKSFIYGRSEKAFEDFYCKTGARIRSELGVKKGNEFINAIKKAAQ